MTEIVFDQLRRAICALQTVHPVARVTEVAAGTVRISIENNKIRVGDVARIHTSEGQFAGEIIRVSQGAGHVLLNVPAVGISAGDRVTIHSPAVFAPGPHWIGRVIDPDGLALDGRPLLPGPVAMPLAAPPPPAHSRRTLGARLETGLAVFNTLLPIVKGQRVGLFAGSGVGKSTLIADLARGVEADVIVIALVGERGRELRHFIDNVLGAEGMKKTIIVAATSDRAAQVRRRCALSATAVAETFREQGQHVLLLIDSVTRFCEAHREVALAEGETADLRGFPASTASAIASLCERAGPGHGDAGDITALFSVLVAGSDMDEPVADMLRGLLDGHVTLDRAIAERGRFPAIDVAKSVSRALPEAASETENAIISEARLMFATYAQAELMIQSGLYDPGSDPQIDAAAACQVALDNFIRLKDTRGTLAHFAKLRQALASSAMQNTGAA